MFESLLLYQGLDAVAGMLLVAFVHRLARPLHRWIAQRGSVWGRSRARRWVCLTAPASILAGLGAMVLSASILQPLVGRVAESYEAGPISVKFLGIGTAYYAWLLWLPLCAVWLAWREAGRVDRALAALWLVLSLAVVVESIVLEPRRLDVVPTRVEVATWPSFAPPLRVVVVADLQTPLLTDREREVAVVLPRLAPDVVLLPGDLVGQSFDDAFPLESARHVLRSIEATRGAFAVTGDVDGFVEGGVARVVEGTPVTFLDNESVVLAGVPTLEIVGFDPSIRDAYKAALTSPRRAEVRIAMVHQPRFAEEIAWRDFDLVVAGHTHGGQVVLPGFGPPMTESPLPRDVARGGLHALTNGVPLYISRGVGMEAGFAPPIRFFCPPELSVLTLHAPGDVTEWGRPTTR